MTMLNLDQTNEYEWMEKFAEKGQHLAKGVQQQEAGSLGVQVLQLYRNWCSSAHELCRRIQKKHNLPRSSGQNHLGSFLINRKSLCESLFECLFLQPSQERRILVSTGRGRGVMCMCRQPVVRQPDERVQGGGAGGV